jgi:hypothetical protein
MSAITPDLLYDPDITLLPHAHQDRPNLWMDRRRIVIGHSPSKRDKKGTDTVFLPAIEILKNRGWDVDVMVIEGVDHATCIEMKSVCSVFFDQAVCSAYGNSAVEAMMMGIPTVTRMDHHVRRADPMYMHSPVEFFDGDCPLMASMAIESVLQDDLQKRSRQTHEWAGGLHSYGSVFRRMMELYSGAMLRSKEVRIKRG